MARYLLAGGNRTQNHLICFGEDCSSTTYAGIYIKKNYLNQTEKEEGTKEGTKNERRLGRFHETRFTC